MVCSKGNLMPREGRVFLEYVANSSRSGTEEIRSQSSQPLPSKYGSQGRYHFPPNLPTILNPANRFRVSMIAKVVIIANHLFLVNVDEIKIYSSV